MRKHIQDREPGQALSIDDLASEFAHHCLEAERTLLAVGWFDEVGLNDAAFAAGLNCNHFLDPGHAFQFGYLCQSADDALQTSVLECAGIAKGAGIALTVEDVDQTIWLTDGNARELDHYAPTVRRLAHQRERASYHIRMAGEVVGEFLDHITRDRPTGLKMPNRLRRAWRCKYGRVTV